MQLLIVATLLGCALSAPPRGLNGHGGLNSHGSVSGATYLGGGHTAGYSPGGFVDVPLVGSSSDGIGIGGGGSIGGGIGGYDHGCNQGEVLHVDGTCVRPQVSRNVFVYSAPELPVSYAPAPHIPRPKVNYNVVFVRTPEEPKEADPIVIPPPVQKTLVYVLTKNGEVGQRVIEVPGTGNDPPQVYYINYEEGQNPTLPGGMTLQEALSNAVTYDGQVIGGTAGGLPAGSYGNSAPVFGNLNAGVNTGYSTPPVIH